MQTQLNNLTVSDLLSRWPQSVSVFQKHKMICAGCAVASLFTVAEVTKVYGLATDTFTSELQQAIILDPNNLPS